MAFFIGLMSGTSLDGVDGVLASFPGGYENGSIKILASASVPFDLSFRKILLSLQHSGPDEIAREAAAANRLASLYAENIRELLKKSGIPGRDVTAAGVHGQTIRHRPELGFTRQTNNPALLAELSGIDIIADFRMRDIAAGGQGAPLVPAFHMAVFGDKTVPRAVVNIGGIANISILRPDGTVTGFDTGPGNMLLDAWIQAERNLPFDKDGLWGKSGTCPEKLLDALLSEPYFSLPPPKSTGRDLFSMEWLKNRISRTYGDTPPAPADVQAALSVLTASSIAKAVPDSVRHIYVCGGGAKNLFLMSLIKSQLQKAGNPASVESSEALGIDPMHVEALAFAWLAYRFTNRRSGNLPSVTGAKGERILGALYPT